MDDKINMDNNNISNAKNIAKNIGGTSVNTALNNRSKDNNTANELENNAKVAAKTAINTGKAVAKASAGDVAGAVKDIAKDEGVQKIVISAVCILLCIMLMMSSLVPNIIFSPSEQAYSENESSVTLHNIINALFHRNSDQTEDDDMMDEYSVKVVAEDSAEYPDFDLAPNNANKTMQKMIKSTQDKYEKRHKALLKYIDKDFNSRKGHLKGTVTKVIADPLSNGTTTTGQEAVKLMSLYSVMNDDNISGISFKDFRAWLGDEESGFFRTKDDEGYDNWYVKPLKWQGSMLSQKLYDQKRKEIENGTFNDDNYANDYTSALSEIVRINPEVAEETHENVYYTTDPETGKSVRHVEYYSIVTYSISAKSVDEICSNIVKFDEAVKKDINGNPLPLDMASHREEYYKELCGTGENEGVALKYFGVQSGGGLYSGNGLGNGRDIVKVAQGEIGVVEVPVNYVKYNDWFYGSHVGGADAPWCAAFVAWCANECGYIDSGIVPKGAHCQIYKEFYGKSGRIALVTDTSFLPKPGDFIVRSGEVHIGIVEKYENGTLYTIEGNSGAGISDVSNNGGCVARHAYGNGFNSIVSAWGSGGYYCRPDYPVSLEGIGEVCFAFESGEQQLGQSNPWYCEDIHDGAGMNFGKMSTNRGQAQNMVNYIIANSENFKNKMPSYSIYSSDLWNWWRGPHSEEDTQEMSELQSAWVWQAYGEPTCTAKSGRYVWLKRSRALQEMALSRAVHRGSAGAVGMFDKAGIKEDMTDAQVITTIYDYEANHFIPAYVRNRFPLEKKMILDNFI